MTTCQGLDVDSIQNKVQTFFSELDLTFRIFTRLFKCDFHLALQNTIQYPESCKNTQLTKHRGSTRVSAHLDFMFQCITFF